MGIETVQGRSLTVDYSMIDNDGSAKKIIDNINQPAPVDRWHDDAFSELMFVICTIPKSGEVETLMGGRAVPFVTPPFIRLAKSHSSFK